MSDLISRQAAIDAVKTYWKQQVDALDEGDGFDTFVDACGAILKHTVGILNAIDQLPPAQPYTDAEIQKMQDLEQAQIEKAYQLGYEEGKKDAQPERKGKWLRYGEDGYPNDEDTVFWQCDQCLEQYTGRTERIPKFCPNCGCKMEVEHETD